MSARSEVQAVMSPRRRMRAMVADMFGVEEHMLVSRSRKREIVRARQVTAYCIRKRWPETSYPTIGALLGGRDHSTIMHSVEVIEDLIKRDPELAGIVTALVGWHADSDDHNAHVIQWRVWTRARESIARRALGRAREPDQNRVKAMVQGRLVTVGGDLAEFQVGGRVWCAQCDKAVSLEAGKRCTSRFCSLKSGRRVG